MENSIEYTEACQSFIDEELESRSYTQWTVPDNDQIDYRGGKDVKIAQIRVSGLGNYDSKAVNKYPSGSVELKWIPYTMEMDRAVRFELGRIDPSDSRFIATVENVTRTFAKMKLVPEQDTFRFNRIYSKLAASEIYKNSHILKVPGLTKDNALAALMGLYAVVKDDSGDDTDFVCFMSLRNEKAFRDASNATNNDVTFNHTVEINGVAYNRCIMVNGRPCIFVPSKRLQTAIKINDGRTAGQEAGGIVTDTSSEQIEFLIMSSSAPISVSKIDSLKIFEADENQTGDETMINYHLLYDLWVLENQVATLAACVQSNP